MRRLRIVGIVLVGALLSGWLWWTVGLGPVKPGNSQNQTFVIGKGDGVREISRKLHDAGLIRDQVVFFLLVKRLGIEKNIQAGSYKLSSGQSASEIALKLTHGAEDKWITIIEGLRSEEIVELLQKEEVGIVNPADLPALEDQWRSYEGHYFPDTYLVPKQITLTGMRQLLLTTFDQKFTPLWQRDTKPTGLTAGQTVVLASLLEREGKGDEERAMIADVLLKRLKAGMPLDVDATVQYALGKQVDGSWWKKELSLEDLKIESVYNTYLNPGLPPSPIGNPGLSALMAAISPQANDFYYYIHDKTGQIHFAKTLTEHNKNIATYLAPQSSP